MQSRQTGSISWRTSRPSGEVHPRRHVTTAAVIDEVSHHRLPVAGLDWLETVHVDGLKETTALVTWVGRVSGEESNGWQFTDGDTGNRTELAMHDRPRVEVGHTYIMAVVWEQARCSPGDPEAPAQWRGLGEGSEIPYDTGVIGTGEQESRTQQVDEAATAVARGTEAGADDGLEERLAGREAAELVAELKAARPGDARQRAAATAAETGCG